MVTVSTEGQIRSPLRGGGKVWVSRGAVCVGGAVSAVGGEQFSLRGEGRQVTGRGCPAERVQGIGLPVGGAGGGVVLEHVIERLGM